MSISMKSVLLGSAAGILATAAAQAADLPIKKAAAVQYVRVCSAYGAGFWEVPGTDMCIKIFGLMKATLASSPPKEFAFISQGAGGAYTLSHFRANAFDNFGYSLSARPGIDLRSPTEYGTLRTVVQMRFDFGGGQDGLPPNGDSVQKTTNLCYRCYIEFNGFTLGRVGSAFPYFNEDDVVAKNPVAKNNTFALWYTWAGANGFNARLAFEDSLVHSAKGFLSTREAGLNLPIAPGFVSTTRGPQKWADVIGVLNLEQEWGDATLRGAVHQITTIARGGNNGITNACPPPVTTIACTSTFPTAVDTGFAITGGVTFKLPQFGKGDQILLQATYGDGALDYVGINGGEVSMGTFDNSQTIISGMNFDHHDAIAINNGLGGYTQEKEKAWSATAVFRHYWAPMVRSNLWWSYAEVTPGAVTQATAWNLGGLGKANTNRIGLNVILGKQKATSELAIEAVYGRTRANVPGVTAANPLPAGLSADGSNWNFALEWSRNW
ncbi:MAG: hypothetical protein QOJ96_11 [Alphaproteobacteria bacterium]|jgi:hypothetical protein|nr:hypothetical protein [Alphaproteobacteria bacterium]